MKTVTLKEAHAPYTLDVDDATLAEGPVRVVHGEQTLGVLVPPDEYEAFCAWRARLACRKPTQPKHERFEREVAAFERMLPDLLQKYRGQVVAIHGGEVVEVGTPGEGVAEVSGRVYERLGYVPVYFQHVTETPRVYRISGPRVVQR
jgi:hypothetical protein